MRTYTALAIDILSLFPVYAPIFCAAYCQAHFVLFRKGLGSALSLCQRLSLALGSALYCFWQGRLLIHTDTYAHTRRDAGVHMQL